MRAEELRKKAQAFHDAFFERGVPNRFEDLADSGASAYPTLLGALASADKKERVDALVMLGRLFASHGHSAEALQAVVEHARRIDERGIGPERHATMFALGRSREPSLLESFITVLAGNDGGRAAVACFVLGYARWQQALPFLLMAAKSRDKDVAPAAIWALGQLRHADALVVLVPMLEAGEAVEWVLGALGDIGEPAALAALAPYLASETVSLKTLATASIWAILDRLADDAKARRAQLWLEPALRAASADRFPPVAAFAALGLVALGAKVEQSALEQLFGSVRAGRESASASEAFFLSRRFD